MKCRSPGTPDMTSRELNTGQIGYTGGGSSYIQALAQQDRRWVRATEALSSVSHCLRELLENSIDAGSTIITAKLGGNGLDLISVSDNGPGIDQDDLHILCNEGATSKELGSNVCGGRGKALDAISSLAHVTIETSSNDQGIGYRLKFDESGNRKIEKIARKRGTTVNAQTLFWPHVVRRRYWIERKQENAKEIHEVAAAFAIAGTYSLTVTMDTKILVQVSTPSRAQRIRNVFGPSMSRGLINGVSQISEWQQDATVEYFTSSPTTTSNGRILLIVNNRPCINPAITKAIKQEFKLCAGPKSPTAVLFIQANRSSFDFLPDAPFIAVTFVNESELQKQICEVLKKAWMSRSETVALKSPMTSPKVSIERSPEPFVARFPKKRVITPSCTCSISSHKIATAYARTLETDVTPETSSSSIDTEAFQHMTVIGQWNLSFIITKLGSDLFAIDQHAACEATNFEKLRKVKTGRKQKLINPIIIPVTPEDEENAILHQSKCSEVGFDYRVLDGKIEVSSMPNDRSIVNGIEDLQEMLGLIADVPSAVPMTNNARARLAYRACHSSVRAGDPMSRVQMRNLLERMSQSDFPWNCPHGRPTWCKIYSLASEPCE